MNRMRTSENRILTTHCGSLPRTELLSDLLLREEADDAVDKVALEREAADGVKRVVRAQIDAGIDIVSDGEQPRVGFSDRKSTR
jgi:5-methyltetrahydropteroyltriglutamate--homocysteine methyltransferase